MEFGEFLTPGWIGLFITISGFITYYLGKIVLDFYPSKEDKAMHHIVGIILFLFYFVIPASLFYYFGNYILLRLNWWTFVLFWIFYGILNYYLNLKFSIFQVSRGQVSNLFLKKFKQMISLFGMNLDNMRRSKRIFTKLPSQLTVIFLGYLLIFLVANMICFFDYLFIQVIIFIATISTFNKVLVLHNATSIIYPKVIIEDLSDKKYSGNLIKQDESYLLLNTGKEIKIFPRENVKLINKKFDINLKNVEKKVGNVAKKTKPMLEKYFPSTQDKTEQQLKTNKPKK